MSADEQTSTAAAVAVAANADESSSIATAAGGEPLTEQERSEKILKAKELYSHGSRNFLVKSYAEAADELSQVCSIYGELHGELSDELGMPYLLYAKSLIALALDENKVIDVPDEEEEADDDDDDEEEGEEEEQDAAPGASNGESSSSSKANGSAKMATIAEDDADSTAMVTAEKEKPECDKKPTEAKEDAEVSSSQQQAKPTNGAKANGNANGGVVNDGEKPSTSNGEPGQEAEEEEDENEAASNLQLAWEILELAARIFTKQGEAGRANLAEVYTELANIEFENNILESARADYDKALLIYKDLPSNYRRAKAEIHYKIGLSYLMQQLNKEGATSLKEACNLIAGEIEEIKAKTDITEKDKNNIQDLEETKQEIEAKIVEIEEAQAQNVAEVRAALDSYIKPLSSGDVDAGTSKSAASGAPVLSSSSSGGGSSSTISSSSKPTDISHLIKRKKPEEGTSEAEAACSPAKRPAV